MCPNFRRSPASHTGLSRPPLHFPRSRILLWSPGVSWDGQRGAWEGFIPAASPEPGSAGSRCELPVCARVVSCERLGPVCCVHPQRPLPATSGTAAHGPRPGGLAWWGTGRPPVSWAPRGLLEPARKDQGNKCDSHN